MPDNEDIIMTDLSASVSATDTSYIDLNDDNLRSPRTPTWTPSSQSSTISPFDYTKFFASSSNKSTPRNSIPPPPDKPLQWVWQCHLCRHRYPIGVTRRCLYDGHYYCSGETDRPNLKKKRKGQACSSEFDYEGWANYGDWKRSILAVMKNPRVPKACEKCDFPSECRTPESQKPNRKKKTTTSSTTAVSTLSDLRKEITISTSSLVDIPMATDESLSDIDIGDDVKQDLAKFRQSKVQELVKIMHEGSRRGDKSEAGRKRSSSVGKMATGGLGIITEEEGAVKKSVAHDLSSLLMPMVDIFNSKSTSKH